MAIVRFDPFRDLASMQDRINRIFGEAYLRNNDDDVTIKKTTVREPDGDTTIRKEVDRD